MQNSTIEMAVDTAFVDSALRWRYATKVFNREKVIPQDTFQLLMEALRLSPSSIGLQPWKFIEVKKTTLRKELFKLSMQQNQIIDASHIVLLCSLTGLDGAYIDRLIELEKQDNKAYSTLEHFRPYVMTFIEAKTKEELKEWMAQQVYIALGFLLATCAVLHIDACPIEAFEHSKVNTLLRLDEYGAESRVIAAIGYRSKQDMHAFNKKLRWPKEEVIITL
jgi:nitroreductase / dihydropteridine reductase